jgi:hypothetical protein
MNVVIVIQLFEFHKEHFVKNIKHNDLHYWQRKDLKVLNLLSMFLDLKKTILLVHIVQVNVQLIEASSTTLWLYVVIKP